MSTTAVRPFRLVLALAMVAAVLWPLVRAVPARAASDGAPMLLGVNTTEPWRDELADFTAELGRAPAFSQIAWKPEFFDTSPPWAIGQLRELHTRGVTGWIEWTVDDVHDLAEGRLDDRVDNLFATIRTFVDDGPGRAVVLAPLPEANLDEHPWARDPVAFQHAFRRMRDRAAAAGLTEQQVRFAFSMNGHSTPGRSYAQFYPGDEHVDLLAFARLNRGTQGPDGWRDYDNVFGEPLADMATQVGTSKPIFVAQTGSVTTGGDRSAWLDDMFSRLAAHPQVIGATYFNDLSGGDHRVHSDRDGIPMDPTFRSGARSWDTADRAAWIFDGSMDQWVKRRGGVPATWPPTTDDLAAASNPFGEDLAVTTRVGASAPIANAIAISQARFVAGDARHAVLSRSDKFPDALAGTPLLGEGPLLLTPTASLDARVRAEIDRALPDGARVYLLGGTKALDPAIEQELTQAGYDVVRLSGPDRFATSRAIAEEVRSLYPEAGRTVLVARGFGTDTNPTAAWADSVTGGGFAAHGRHPVVLSLSHELSADAAAIVDGADVAYLLGGRSALQDAVLTEAAQRAGGAARISGSARDGTAVEVMSRLWGAPSGEGRYLVIDGYSEQGWAFGLPAAGLAAEFSAPLLPVAPNALPPETAAALRSCSFKRVATVVVGTASVVSDAVLASVEEHDRSC